jgi:hypothetical protein
MIKGVVTTNKVGTVPDTDRGTKHWQKKNKMIEEMV